MAIIRQPIQQRGSLKEELKDIFLGGTGQPLLTRHDIVSSKWPKDYLPFTFAFISDLHVGCPAVTLKRLEKVVARINALRPDAIFLGGDYMNDEGFPNGPMVEPGAMAKVLRHLKPQSRHGLISIFGNHDHDHKQAVGKAFRENGIIMLENDVYKITPKDRPDQKICIAGMGDYLTGTLDLSRVFEKVRGEPVIMLEHNPSGFDLIRKHQVTPVVTMCGHTHGGQLGEDIPGRKLKPLPETPWDYVLGNLDVDGETQIVSAGLGTSWLPIRAQCPARIELVTLRNG